MADIAAEVQRPLLLSDSGLLVHGELRVQLSGTDSALVRRLLERHPLPLTPRDAMQLLWPARRPSDAALRRRLARIRRELIAVGLALRHQRGIGFTLERAPFDAGAATPR